METIATIVSLSCATVKLMNLALQLRASANRNDAMVKELDQLLEELKRNIDLLLNIRCRGNGFEDETAAGLVLDALSNDMAGAKDEMDEIVREMNQHHIIGKIMRGATKSTAQRIASLRERIHRSFQTKMSTLSVALHQTHCENSRRIWTNVDGGRNENRLAFAHMSDRFQTLEERLQMMESNLKCFQDVMAGLGDHQRPSEHTRSKSSSTVSVDLRPVERKDKLMNAVPEWCADPITRDVMCDPVIASDGYTYDRWTILEQRGPDPCLRIVNDNAEMLECIIEHFPHQVDLLIARRITYRDDALQRYKQDGKQEEARLMLGHVLEWDHTDQECNDIIINHHA